MAKYIKTSNNHLLNLEIIREIILRENGDIEIRYSSVDYEVLHFDSLCESRKMFNTILSRLEIEEGSYTPKCFNNSIKDLCAASSAKLGTRIEGACIRNNIKTIGDLIAFGKHRFEKQPNIGVPCIEAITTFLRDTYGYVWKY